MAQFISLDNRIVNVDHIRVVEMATDGKSALLCIQGHPPVQVKDDALATLLKTVCPDKQNGLKEISKKEAK